MLKNRTINKVFVVLAIAIAVNYKKPAPGKPGAKPAAAGKPGAKPVTTTKKPVLTTKKTTTKSKPTTKQTPPYKPSRYQTSCYTCNQHLLNPKLTFINNLRHFRNTCQKVDKRNIDQCRFAGSCYTAKFGPYFVRGCISRRTCQLFKKTKNISRLNLANFPHFNPDSFDCCKGNLCNKKKLKNKAVSKQAQLGSPLLLALAFTIVKIFS